ncbi:DNA repair protein RadC [Candidatus Magnetoovum chiemensis]|nr:DNA repair protein RadC [Candidatus Magnetoovum chiemensis]
MKKEELADYIGHRQRLREKYLRSGANALNDYEMLELLLMFVIERRDVKPHAKALLAKFKGIKGVLDAEHEDLIEINGIGNTTALFLKLVKDVGSLYLKEKHSCGKSIKAAQDIADYLVYTHGALKDEHFIAIFLNCNNEIVAEEVICEGTVDHVVIYTRKVFENALKHKAASIIFVHNHPGGSLKPSSYDIKLTRKLKLIAESMSINVLDHLIITNSGFASMKEKGLL